MRLFDFSKGKCENGRIGRKAHVIVSLNDMLTSEGLSTYERDVIQHTIKYIKELESEVSRHQPITYQD